MIKRFLRSRFELFQPKFFDDAEDWSRLEYGRPLHRSDFKGRLL